LRDKKEKKIFYPNNVGVYVRFFVIDKDKEPLNTDNEDVYVRF